MSKKFVLSIIIGSTRPTRFGEHPSSWIENLAVKRPELTVKVLDLKNIDLPFFNDPISPAYKTSPYSNSSVEKWTAEIASSDAFIIVTPEYNHGPSAVVKNSLDWVFKEWNHKPVGFVSYGSTGGSRAIEQLRLNCIELSMVPVRSSVHIQNPWNLKTPNGDLIPKAFDQYEQSANSLLDQINFYLQKFHS